LHHRPPSLPIQQPSEISIAQGAQLAQARSVTDCGMDQQAQRNVSDREPTGGEFFDDGHRAEKRLSQFPYNERSAIV
jgi:hypothetical protein